ncbi:MAG: O-antigen ligase family protein [Desulfobulbaceae bacterium]|nr:O-antigen ligase family protein [Desulfobulbaceae bacterium]
MAFPVLLFVLLCYPLAFGGELQWSRFLAQAAIFTAALVYFGRPGQGRSLYRAPGFLPLVLLLGFLAVQIVPLPADALRFLSPAAGRLYQNTIGLVGQPRWLTLSINPVLTLSELLRLASYVVCYLLTVHLLTDRARLKKTVWAVVSLGALMSFQALLQKQFSNGRVLWFYEVPSNFGFFGPYFNYNHFAGFMGMLAPIAIALYFYYRPRLHYGLPWRQRLADLLLHPDMHLHLRLALASVVMGSAIVISSSRGGTISFCLSSSILLAALHWRERKSIPAILAGLSLIVCFILAVGGSGWGVMDQRLGQALTPEGELSDGRLQVWADSLPAMADYRLTGSGWGTFSNIYPSYRTVPYGRGYHQAHNDYIETFITGGAVSVALLAWFLFDVVRHIGRALKKRRDPYAINLTYGCLAGLLALLFHGVTDFNFQIPANGLYFFFLAGLAVSAAHTRGRGSTATYLPRLDAPLIRFGLVGLAGILLAGSLALNVTQGMSETHRNRAGDMELTAESPRDDLRRMAAETAQAVALAPLDPFVHYRAAQANVMLGDVQEAHRLFKRAILLNPGKAFYQMEYAEFLAGHGEKELAAKFYEAGVKHERAWPDYRRDYAKFLLAGFDREKGLSVMTEVLAMDPAKNQGDIQLLLDSGVTVDEIRQTLPKLSAPYLALAGFQEKKGDLVMAETLYRAALTLIVQDEKPKAGAFYAVFQFFMRQKRHDDALAVILQATEVLPKDAYLLASAGDLYRTMGLPSQAMAMYRQVLILAPAREDIRKRLKSLEAR